MIFRPAAATVLPAGLPSGSIAVCSASTTAWSLDGAVGCDPPDPDPPPTADRGADTGGVEADASCMLPADAGALPVITGTGDGWLTGRPALTGPPATGRRQNVSGAPGTKLHPLCKYPSVPVDSCEITAFDAA